MCIYEYINIHIYKYIFKILIASQTYVYMCVFIYEHINIHTYIFNFNLIYRLKHASLIYNYILYINVYNII